MTNAEVLHQVEHGYRMASPQNCPPALYDIMLECWHKVLESPPQQLSFYLFLRILIVFFIARPQFDNLSIRMR